MDIGMTMDELAARLPLEQSIPITEAAERLGGGENRVKALMDLVMTGGLFSWSHSCPHREQSRRIYHKIDLVENVPYLTPDTEPSTVMIKSDSAIWKWCFEVEALLQDVDIDEAPPIELVKARHTALKRRAYELKCGTPPAPVGSASTDSDTTVPASRWPWGNHHTEALGHLEAAALRFWGSNYDPNDPATAPTNEQVSEWLHKQRKVSKTLSDAMASILRLDGLKTGPRK